MLKRRMTLSLVALISSVFLFVFATFAWFAVTQIIDIFGPNVNIVNLEVSATLEVSDDGITYVSASEISLENTVPGSIKYYRLTVENVGDVEVYAKISLYGFLDQATDSGITYDDSVNLLEKIVLNASNNVNAEDITDDYLIDLLPESISDYTTSHVYLVGSMYLDTEDIGVLDFSLQVSPTANNQYQNHALDITNITIVGVNP
ncbi:MAG: hypothetical protein WC251_04200 [Candidatus Izemoplasmatales bacterium]|nr:hypothetical protein [Candidatus Izemoplasmatales bacterium]NLF49480.1 hypothetical protein [Acholeplasmataceae bacterium]